MTMLADSLQLTLTAPARVRPGVPILFTLRVRNQTQRALDLYLRGRTATFDLIVAREGGEVVWRRLEDEIIPAIVHLRVLRPGEEMELAAEWDQRARSGSSVAPGEYSARALLLAEGEPLEAPPVRLQIAER
ncbi:MAG: hypothetical protein HY705_09210 [Gemmatimonadetes bacterium]|nr:hypothetical protein [Gemmatimonadota bacterium]